MEVSYMIRLAENKDIPDILRLLVQVNMVHHITRPDLFNGPATKYTQDELKEIIKDPLRPIFVYDDGKVLGYAFCIHQQHINDNILTDVKTLYIDDLCVDEAARGKHIGHKLYDYVIDYAKKNKYYNVTLNVWEGNDSAMAFYKSIGLKVQKVGMECILK